MPILDGAEVDIFNAPQWRRKLGIDINTPASSLTEEQIQGLLDLLNSGAGSPPAEPATTVTPMDQYDLPSVVGTSTKYAREDHRHSTPEDPIPLIIALS